MKIKIHYAWVPIVLLLSLSLFVSTAHAQGCRFGGTISGGCDTSDGGGGSSGGSSDPGENEGVINTAEITAYTMEAALQCMDWELRGVCIWMSCATFVCTFDVSTKVANFAPELTIQTYNFGNDEPWGETKYINEGAQAAPDSEFVKALMEIAADYNFDAIDLHGGYTSPGHKGNHANLHHRTADAYGNPALVAYMALSESLWGLVCDPKATPLFPYYIGNLDVISWRWAIPELIYPQSFLVGIYDLGELDNNYGPIYPRSSMTIHQDSFKSAVLGVFRAAHFITRTGQPHVYFPLDAPDGKGRWPPAGLSQNDANSGQFQMLYPDVETDCRSFPYGATPGLSKRDTTTQYVWNFWRKHKCCQRRGDQLIFHSG